MLCEYNCSNRGEQLMSCEYEQLSLFEMPISTTNVEKNNTKDLKDVSSGSPVSEEILQSFSIMELPFFGCDFDSIYPKLLEILPQEQTSFDCFSLNEKLTCEIICAAICHQMNWDYLRNVVFEKTKDEPSWLLPDNLSQISEDEIADLFASYPKRERVRKAERTSIIRDVGRWLKSYSSVSALFLAPGGDLLSCAEVRHNLLSCKPLANDPEEKKMQLLLQKASAYTPLEGLEKYYRPAIDYHLIRCYLRRGLIFAKTKSAINYIENKDSKKKESTVAAIRKLCSDLLTNICDYTSLSILSVNQIEWNIGRSICVQDCPDCTLHSPDASWLKPHFTRCPFYVTCAARQQNPALLTLNEPNYLGTSY